MNNGTISSIRDYNLDMDMQNDGLDYYSEVINTEFNLSDAGESTFVRGDEEKNAEETISLDQKEKADKIYRLKNTVASKVVCIDSYYDSVEEFYGVIDTIDAEMNTFEASLKPVSDNSDAKIIKATFDIDDIQESDKKLLSIGTQLVWLIGKERKENNVRGVLKPGGITNVSRIHIRRTRVLSQKKRIEIEEQANEWSQFFAGLNREGQ